jgi:DNA polymerase III psi subunit
MHKRTVIRKVNNTVKQLQAPRRLYGIRTSSVAKAMRMMIAAQRSLNAQKPVVISQRTRRISTNRNWVNALEIERNPAWVAPRSGESYVWGRNDPNGPAAVVARRFTIRNDIVRANLFLSVDNFAIVIINGRSVVIDNPQANVSFFNPGRSFNIRRFLRRGTNDIVIAAFNFPSNANRSRDNPAGVLARIEFELED